MIDSIDLLNQLVRYGRSGRFQKLHDKLKFKAVAVFIMVCIHRGHNTREKMNHKRKSEINSKDIELCKNRGWLRSELINCPHFKGARMHTYSLTPLGKQQVEEWLTILEPIVERTNASLQKSSK